MRYGWSVLSKEGKVACPTPQFCNFRNPTFEIVIFQEARNGTVVWFLVSFDLELFQNARFFKVGKRHELVKKLELEI